MILTLFTVLFIYFWFFGYLQIQLLVIFRRYILSYRIRHWCFYLRRLDLLVLVLACLVRHYILIRRVGRRNIINKKKKQTETD